MAKEVAIMEPSDISEFKATEAALVAYRFGLENAGLNMDDEGAVADFIALRNGKSGWRDLVELQKKADALSKSIKEVLKHTWNVGSPEDLPDTNELKVSWNKQSYTYDFVEGEARVIAQSLIDSGLTTKEQLFDQLSVSGMVKAAGITTEKMLELFGEGIIVKPKERVLNIK